MGQEDSLSTKSYIIGPGLYSPGFDEGPLTSFSQVAQREPAHVAAPGILVEDFRDDRFVFMMTKILRSQNDAVGLQSGWIERDRDKRIDFKYNTL